MNNFHAKIIFKKLHEKFLHDFRANLGAIFARETQENFHKGQVLHEPRETRGAQSRTTVKAFKDP